MPRHAVVRFVASALLSAGALVSTSTLRAQALSLTQLEAICGAPLATSVQPEEEARLIRDLQELDDGVGKHLEKIQSSTDPKQCASELDKLDGNIEERRASSQSLCDRRAARGIGANAADSLASMRVASDELDAALDAPKPRSVEQCKKQGLALGDRWRSWASHMDEACPPQARSRDCEQDQSHRDAIDAVCAAYASNSLLPAGQLQLLASCAAQREPRLPAPTPSPSPAPSGRSPRAPGGTGAGERGLGGGELQTAMLQGVADFFVQRAEQEISLFTADVVGQQLCDSEVATYLEETCGLLDPKGDEPALGATPAALREALRADLEELPRRVAEQAQQQGDPALACGVALGWSAAREVLGGARVAALLSNPDPLLAEPLPSAQCDEPLQHTIRELAKAFQRVLENGASDVADGVRAGKINAVLSLSELRAPGGIPRDEGEQASRPSPRESQPSGGVSRDEGGQASGASPRESHARGPALVDQATKATEVGQVVGETLWRLRELDSAVSTWEGSRTAGNRALAVAAGIRAFEPVLVYVVASRARKNPTQAADRAREARAAVELATHVANHEYVRAIMTLPRLPALNGVGKARVRAALSLAGSLAQANSSAEVQSTMNAAALPLGAWRRKNLSRWGATLTGVVGILPAREIVIERPSDGTTVSSGMSLAPALLVGADIHHGISRSWRFGLNLSVLDLGALGSIRLQEPKVEGGDPGDSAQQNPKVRLEQVLAPTAFPYIGLGPIDFGPAVGLVPSLRSAREASGATRVLDVMRIGFVLGADVSVLPLL